MTNDKSSPGGKKSVRENGVYRLEMRSRRYRQIEIRKGNYN